MKVLYGTREGGRSYKLIHVIVDAGELADAEKMLYMVDGTVGNFGFSARLIRVGDQTFGMPSGKEMIDYEREYEIFVDTD